MFQTFYKDMNPSLNSWELKPSVPILTWTGWVNSKMFESKVSQSNWGRISRPLKINKKWAAGSTTDWFQAYWYVIRVTPSMGSWLKDVVALEIYAKWPEKYFIVFKQCPKILVSIDQELLSKLGCLSLYGFIVWTPPFLRGDQLSWKWA